MGVRDGARRARRRPWPLVALPLAACSLVRPLDYLHDGHQLLDGGGAPESSSAGPIADAGPDATWCQRQDPVPFFCADFDEGDITNTYAQGRGSTMVPPELALGGTVALTNGFSSPGALSATTAAVSAAGKNAFARLNSPAEAQSQAKHVRLTFAMKIIEASAFRTTIVTIFLENPDGGAPLRVFYYLASDESDLLDLEGTRAPDLFRVPKPSRSNWVQVAMDVTLNTTTVDAQLMLEGAHVGAATNGAPFPSAIGATFILGLDSESPSDPVTIAFDNVAFYVE
jgi:hypothetical protein